MTINSNIIFFILGFVVCFILFIVVDRVVKLCGGQRAPYTRNSNSNKRYYVTYTTEEQERNAPINVVTGKLVSTKAVGIIPERTYNS